MRARRLLLLTAAACTLVVAASCGGTDPKRPSIRIVSPQNGDTIDAQSLFVTVDVKNFTLVPTIAGPGAGDPYFGHWHLYLDYQPYADVLTSSAVMTGIPPGEHVLDAELANENETPVSGTPLSEITFTVPSTAPGLSLVAPADGSNVNSSSVDLSLATSNFVLDSAALPTQADHGFVQVFLGGLGGTPQLEGASPDLTLTDLAPGSTADVWVALAGPNHILLQPPVFDHRSITIPSSAPDLTLLSPANGAVLSGSQFGVTVAVQNFQLVDFAGAPADSAGQGHYHVLFDGSDLGPAFAVTSGGWSMSTGSHRIRVELRTNTDHPLSPPVVDDAVVTVQ